MWVPYLKLLRHIIFVDLHICRILPGRRFSTVKTFPHEVHGM
eukprot:SAG11_NODE_19507_length_465_cov_0.991803_2_plen_41_part_01